MSRSLLFGMFALFCSILLVACSNSSNTGPSGKRNDTNNVVADPEPGEPIFVRGEFSKPETGSAGADPIVMPVCHVTIIPSNKCDVPSPEEGQVAFVGVEINANEIPAGIDLNELYQHPRTKKVYRMLKPNQLVKKDQVIAILDDTKAFHDHRIAIAALEGSKKEANAADATTLSIKARYEITKDAFRRNAATPLEVASEEANYNRYLAEAEAKKTQINRYEPETLKAKDRLEKHEIRSPFNGQVQSIYKGQKEGVKQNETMFQIVNFDRLRIEGFLERQFLLNRVIEGMAVQIEPNILVAPTRTEATFHRGKAITAVAFSQNTKEPYILSAGEDGSVFVWNSSKVRLATWRHPGTVRTVAATGPKVKSPWAITGCDDGYARIFSLAKLGGEAAVTLTDRHEGGVKAAAFSPDGAYCVTADGVRNLYLWDTATGKLKYRFPQRHNDFVTALYFLPQCRVVSVGKDNTVNVWMMGTESAALEKEKCILYRTGDVGVLGVTDDGNRILVDSAKNKLHIVHLGDGQTERVLSQPVDGAQFRTFALFSPEIGANKQRLLLTASNTNGELQLWRMPTATERGSELATLTLPQNGIATCAAFSPASEGGFIAVGTKQGEIYLWNMPTEADINHRWVGRITQIDSGVDTSGKSIKISAEFDNDKDDRYRLRPGTTVTLVVKPVEQK